MSNFSELVESLLSKLRKEFCDDILENERYVEENDQLKEENERLHEMIAQIEETNEQLEEVMDQLYENNINLRVGNKRKKETKNLRNGKKTPKEDWAVKYINKCRREGREPNWN